MTTRRRARLARRRLKAHDKGISNRHDPAHAWQLKQVRLRNERGQR